LNGRPSLNLDIGGLANLRVKPFGDERMKSREGHGRRSYHAARGSSTG
jgi:hypothetical protein